MESPFLTEPQYLSETDEQEGIPSGENGLRELELDPPPEVIEQEDITLDIAYRVCFCLQEDPEAVLFSEKTVELPDRPPLAHVQKLLDLLVVNSGDYEVPEMHPAEVKILMATLTEYFIRASRVR
jgi:hypothetical protein